MIITRADKGEALTHNELDANLIELDKIPNGKVFPKTKGVGVKIDTDNPDFGWHDLIGHINSGQGTSTFQIYRGGIKQAQFEEGQDAYIGFHIPHDYLPGSPLFIHAHWSHTSPVVTGGTVTWAFETMYAKGHNQAQFEEPVVVSIVSQASILPYQHMIPEAACSTSGGSVTQLDTNLIETDGVIQCRLYLDSNDIITSDSSIVKPFVHFVDIHYQSTGLPTKNKAPNFWGV